jgi:hypothetical protein
MVFIADDYRVVGRPTVFELEPSSELAEMHGNVAESRIKSRLIGY